jgi:hypothetical protein
MKQWTFWTRCFGTITKNDLLHEKRKVILTSVSPPILFFFTLANTLQSRCGTPLGQRAEVARDEETKECREIIGVLYP